jgi:chorismate lyase
LPNPTSILFRQEPRWRDHIKGSQHQFDEITQSWIYEADSLTKRLRDCYGDIRVQVLQQGWFRPYFSECRELRLQPFRRHLTREVMLHHRGKPLLMARTIIPTVTLKAAHRNLAHLGSRPLGEVIFSYPDLERTSMGLAQIPPEKWRDEIRQLTSIDQPVWGRRTHYAIAHRPLLISEFFLPSLLV